MPIMPAGQGLTDGRLIRNIVSQGAANPFIEIAGLTTGVRFSREATTIWFQKAQAVDDYKESNHVVLH